MIDLYRGDEEDYMGAAVRSVYPIVLGGLCASYTMRDVRSISHWKFYSLHRKEFKPFDFGRMKISDATMHSDDLITLLEAAMKNWYGLDMLWYDGSPSLHNVFSHRNILPQNRNVVLNPDSKEYELPLLAALAVTDVDTMSDTFFENITREAQSLRSGAAPVLPAEDQKIKVVPKRELNPQEKAAYLAAVDACLALRTQVKATPLFDTVFQNQYSCPFYSKANSNIEAMLDGSFGFLKSDLEYLAWKLNRTMESLEKRRLVRFPQELKDEFRDIENRRRTTGFEPERYQAALRKLQKELIEQYWSPLELENARRYLHVLRKFYTLSEKRNAYASSIPLRRIAKPERYVSP